MELLTIGAFARAAKLTPRALRLYDETGLLPPAAVDPDSGYRFYEPGQVRQARLIADLRRIGMPLSDISAVAGQAPAEVAAAVEAYWRRETAQTTARARQVTLLLEDLSRRNPIMSEITIRSAARCETGEVRESNQDAAYADDRLLAVADGGGGPAGAQASAAAIDALKRLDLAGDTAAGLLTALASTVGELDQELRGTAITTLTAILRRGSQLALVHIGDTRVYLLRGGELSQLTHDHTWVQGQVDHGKLDPAAAITHPQRALLVRALGGPNPVEADLALRTALPGDRYLLCSDGLSAVVDRAALQAALTGPGAPGETVQRLVDLAVEAGAPDNIACVVADIAN
ncbi:MerR family transcriptional regulator [Actinoplanes sp. NPDC026619]|uniref:MerR family transcriptional regulator n=1 Tax=Actinoplanes sp. NPDC026619 TaxID=3155798 RepID=UPI0033FC1D5F